MEGKGTITVRFFSFLETFRKDQGLPSCLEVSIPESGRPGMEIARDLGIPAEMIEAVFRNGVIQNVYDPIYPGDRVAFVPPGMPGPYRVLLGMVREKVERARREGGPKDKH
jgi:hypothetical protein